MSAAQFMQAIALLGEKAQTQLAGIPAHDPRYAQVATALLRSSEVPEFEVNFYDSPLLNQESRQHFRPGLFSDRSRTILRGDNWFIDLYLWDGRDTGIHDHNFAGAFRILKGTYFQVVFDFRPGPVVEGVWEQGRMSVRRQEILKFGDVHPITVDADYIHQTYHPQRPAVTLCLRSENCSPYLSNYLLSGARFGGKLQNPLARTLVAEAAYDWHAGEKEQALSKLAQLSVADLLLSFTPVFIGTQILVCDWWEEVAKRVSIDPATALQLGQELTETQKNLVERAWQMRFMAN